MHNNKCKKAHYACLLISCIIIICTPSCKKQTYIPALTRNKQYSLKVDSTQQLYEMESFMKAYRDSLAIIMQQQIGYTETPLTFAQPESNLGNLVADAVWQTSNANQSIDMVVLSTQILANHYLAPGKISLGNCYELIPKEHALIIASLTGNQVQQLSDSIAAAKGLPVAGCQILIGTTKKTSILIAQQSPKEQLLYSVCFDEDLSKLWSFRFLQNSQYTYKSKTSVRAALIAYLKHMQTIKHPLNTKLEQRISYE